MQSRSDKQPLSVAGSDSISFSLLVAHAMHATPAMTPKHSMGRLGVDRVPPAIVFLEAMKTGCDSGGGCEIIVSMASLNSVS